MKDRRKVLRAAAVFLCLCIGVSNIAGCVQKETYVIRKAEYPEMAPYPNERSFVDEKTGEFDSEGFDQVYEAWWKDKRERRAREDSSRDGLEAFCSLTMPVLLGEAEGENRVYSPLNLYLALGMLAEVTDGESREQILDLLGVSDVESLRERCRELWNVNYCRDGAVTSVPAGSFWLRNDISYHENTLKRLAENYYASSFEGEMGTAAYDQALQDWIKEQTGGLLKEQADELTMEPETVLALVSTIYYQAKWANEFLEANTEDGIFHGAGGDEATAFLHQGISRSYFWNDSYGAVCLGLKESGGMWLFLPDEGVDAEELLTDPSVWELISHSSEAEWPDQKFLIVNLALPKFDVVSDLDLRESLQELGVTDVFDAETSDFSPLTEKVEKIYLSKVQHAARVTVDEEGVTAAAYTAMIACGAGRPPEEEMDFVLDRPFLFVLTGESGTPLFIGVVNHP